ncbi:MAG: hypothetical protein ACREQ5_11215, partial [Candidatus Dormibacteria bacterium]
MTIKLDTIIEKYVMLRDKRANLKRSFEEQDEELRNNQNKLEAYLLRNMNEQGVDTIKTQAGTAYIQIKARAFCADWSLFWKWTAENSRVDMLEKRVSSRIIQEYEVETGELPPGIN